MSAEPSTVCAYLFITTPDTLPPSQSFDKHVNTSSLTHSSRRTCHNMRMKPWLILPFVHLSSSDLTSNAAALGSRKQMEPCLHWIKKGQGRRFRPFSVWSLYKQAASSASAALRAVSRSAAKRGQGATLLRKPFLKELGSVTPLRWPPERSRSGIRGEWKEVTGGHLRHPLSPSRPIYGDRVSYTRGFRAALSAANSRWEKGFREQRAVDATHQTLQSLS